MASYTADQLKGAGTPTERLEGSVVFELENNSTGSAYFTVETVRNYSGSYSGQPTNALGTYASFSSIDPDTLVTSSYISSVVVPQGSSTYQFTPTETVAVSSSMLRATGEVSLTIS